MRLLIRHAIVQYAANVIMDDVNFEIRDNEKIAVVGRNGCGKTSLLKLIAGDVEMGNLDSDEEACVAFSGRQRVGFLKQISFEDGEILVEDEIKKSFSEVFDTEKRMKEIEELLKNGEDRRLFAEYDELQKKMDALRGYTWKQDMEVVFQKFGFELSDLKKPISEFSGGQQTKIAFIKLLLSRPDIMLLDEPTNHLDLPTIEWLESYLKSYDKAVVIVSHDRMFLDNVVSVTYEIEYGIIKRYSGNYTAFIKQKEENYTKQLQDYERQQEEIARLTKWIEMWKETPTKVSQTRSKRKVIEHMKKIEKPRRFDTKVFKACFSPKRQSYSDVLTTKKLKIGYDEVLSEVTFAVKKNDRIAIIGENGKGKSTLLKTVVGLIPALSGDYKIGTNVDIGYFDQQMAVNEEVIPGETVLENFWRMYPDLLRNDVRSALGAFMFSETEVEKEMSMLSGGEKVRLCLCKMFYTKPNFLILDEPTNHMDMIGKDALEKMLCDFEGTVLFVSHDRYFIKTIATGILEFGNDEVRQYHGTYDEYLEEKKKRESGDRRTDYGKVKQDSIKRNEPTLEDVFDKKKYYNPGKIKSRLEKQLEKYETQIEESEEKIASLKLELCNPEYASMYEKLMELNDELEKEEKNQESLLERMVETETELSLLE